MNQIHEMLIEDEIMMCGMVLILGIVIGGVARVLRGTVNRAVEERKS